MKARNFVAKDLSRILSNILETKEQKLEKSSKLGYFKQKFS